MNSKWFKDILAQSYPNNNYCDPTKIFLVLAMTEPRSLKNRYSVREIAMYVYRYYAANHDIASRNFSPIIRNIKKYGIDDIVPIVLDAIQQWIKEQPNGSIAFDESVLLFNIEDYSEETRELTRIMMSTLYQKYYGDKLRPIFDYSTLAGLDDLNLVTFNNTEIKDLIFEDIQYCPLTEETNKDNLYAFHLFLSSEGANDIDRTSKDNLLLLTKELALDYINDKFYFNDLGKVVNINSCHIVDGMRIGVRLLTKKRKEYIMLHNKALANRNIYERG